MPKRAVILSGALGLGHDVVSEVLSGSLAGLGWESRTLDCMALLGPRAGPAGDWVFRRLMSRPGVYDGLHFAHLRAGSRLAAAMDHAATPRLLAALRRELRDEPADLIISVFAAGVPAAAALAGSARGRVALAGSARGRAPPCSAPTPCRTRRGSARASTCTW